MGSRSRGRSAAQVMAGAAAALWLAAPGVAAAQGVTLEFTGAEAAERISTTYTCPDREPFGVEYVNAGPNSLAILPVDGDTLLFVAVLSGSGVKYVSGPHSWWSKGKDAALANEMQPEAEPVTCTEVAG